MLTLPSKLNNESPATAMQVLYGVHYECHKSSNSGGMSVSLYIIHERHTLNGFNMILTKCETIFGGTRCHERKYMSHDLGCIRKESDGIDNVDFKRCVSL